jgi:hypothetical protein
MSSPKFVGHRSLFADVSFADLWRAARYRQSGVHAALPISLEAAHASRFAAQSQPFATDVGVGEVRLSTGAEDPRWAA